MVSERKLSVTITGPEGMLGAMASLLRDEGYFVEPPCSQCGLADNTTTTQCKARAQDGKHYPANCSWCEERYTGKARTHEASVCSACVGGPALLEALMREAIDLWHEWSTTDITADDDRWSSYTDRVHAWVERARRVVPERAPKPAPKRPPPRKKRPPPRKKRPSR